MNHPTMPDPFTSHAQGVSEIPIREVISRLASLVGGPLTEYVTEAHSSDALAAAVDDVTAGLDHLLTLWDDRARLATPEQVADTVNRVMAGAPEPIGPYPGRPDLEERANRKRAEFVTRKPLPQRLTPDQIEAGERHARLQAGGEE